jgi:hypothetical protein
MNYPDYSDLVKEFGDEVLAKGIDLFNDQFPTQNFYSFLTPKEQRQYCERATAGEKKQ